MKPRGVPAQGREKPAAQRPRAARNTKESKILRRAHTTYHTRQRTHAGHACHSMIPETTRTTTRFNAAEEAGPHTPTGH